MTQEGLSLLVDEGKQPSLILEAAGDRRMRLRGPKECFFWARIEEGFYGVFTLRKGAGPIVVRPIRAQEARKHIDSAWWMHWFADQLETSACSPLRGGEWHLTEMVRRPGSRDVLVPKNLDGLPSPALEIRRTLERPRTTYEDWGSHGSARTMPLRDPSPLDAGRIKSWIKHAKADTLPPILFWWVSGLDSHLLLDGHDRLAAALHAGTLPRVLVLWQSLEVPSLDEPDDEFLENYTALFENPEVNELARIQLNAKLVAQHRDTHRRAMTLAKARLICGRNGTRKC